MQSRQRPVNSRLCRSARLATLWLVGGTGSAQAHAAQSGLVLLLPTDIYAAAGVAAVAVSVAVVSVLPGAALARLFRPWHLGALPDLAAARRVTGLLSLAVLGLLIAAGYLGPADPLSNPLPLTIWTLWWIGFVTVQGLFGDLWAWLNPFGALPALVHRRAPPPLRLPRALGQWPAVALFLLAMSFALADTAPDSPRRLAGMVAGYALFTLAGIVLFGAPWLARCECFTVMLGWFARLAPVRARRRLGLGVPGWRALVAPAPDVSGAVFLIILLGTGSFDGLNETFWWLARIDINPLAFPGRSEIVWETTFGLLGANLLLVGAVWGCAALGRLLVCAFAPAGPAPSTRAFFCGVALSLLPIALGYHVAHYLTAFLINGQYALVALSDPLARGADLLGLGRFYVSTGMFNTRDTVRAIFLTQAGAVVIGHVFGVLMAHRITSGLFAPGRATLLAQAPLALFMILYTLLGLWLLAAPRGA